MSEILYSENAKITIGSTIIAVLGELSLTIDEPLINVETLGSTDTEEVVFGVMSVDGSFSGVYYNDDVEPETLKTIFLNSSGINNFRIYLSDIQYWCSDTDNDDDATCYFSNVITFDPSNEIWKLDLDFKFSGKVKEVNL